ncbi:MAG: O-antigen ligase family protein [Planctomycetota bacterium]
MTWWISIGVLSVIMLWQWWSNGARQGLAWISLLSILLPSWLAAEFLGLPVPVRTVVCVIGLGAYCLHPQSNFPLRLGLIDLSMLALFVTHIVSDLQHSQSIAVTLVEAYGEWFVPYVTARLAFQSLADVRDTLPLGVAIVTILACLSIFEGVTRINPIEMAFGKRPLTGTTTGSAKGIVHHGKYEYKVRWGMRRAFGPTMHPIYFGTLQLILAPWALYAAARTNRGVGPLWWKVLPILSFLGIFFTMSRGPILGFAVLAYAYAFFRRPQWRIAMAGIAVAGIVAVAMFPNAFVGTIKSASGEAKKFPRYVQLGDRRVEKSGTMTRLYLFSIYKRAMLKAGLFGYGSESVSSFPIRVPVDPDYVTAVKDIRFIDNVYIQTLLRFGYLGLAFLTAAGLFACMTFATMGWNPDMHGSAFCSAMACSILAVMLVMLTVWFPQDYAFWLLWNLGVAAGLVPEWRRYAAQQEPDFS